MSLTRCEWSSQSKPHGKTAKVVEQTTELRNCLGHPRVEMAVISQDSLFSQVWVVSSLIAFTLVQVDPEPACLAGTLGRSVLRSPLLAEWEMVPMAGVEECMRCNARIAKLHKTEQKTSRVIFGNLLASMPTLVHLCSCGLLYTSSVIH